MDFYRFLFKVLNAFLVLVVCLGGRRSHLIYSYLFLVYPFLDTSLKRLISTTSKPSGIEEDGVVLSPFP